MAKLKERARPLDHHPNYLAFQPKVAIMIILNPNCLNAEGELCVLLLGLRLATLWLVSTHCLLSTCHLLPILIPFGGPPHLTADHHARATRFNRWPCPVWLLVANGAHLPQANGQQTKATNSPLKFGGDLAESTPVVCYC